MSIPTAPTPILPWPSPGPRHSVIVVQDEVVIPPWVDDLDSYRRWAWSAEYPKRGRLAFLNGAIWVDLTMEEFFTHNQVKTPFTLVLGNLVSAQNLGRFVADRMLLTNKEANLSTEPDGMLFRWETMQTDRIRLVQNEEKACLELEGSPDVVLEIISKTSLRKDTVLLRELYWKAKIPEYWLVDARAELPVFSILRWASAGYAATESADGWQRSDILGREFRLIRDLDPLRHPRFAVEMR